MGMTENDKKELLEVSDMLHSLLTIKQLGLKLNSPVIIGIFPNIGEGEDLLDEAITYLESECEQCHKKGAENIDFCFGEVTLCTDCIKDERIRRYGRS